MHLELTATDREGKSGSIEKWTNTLLVLVFSWYLVKYKITPAMSCRPNGRSKGGARRDTFYDLWCCQDNISIGVLHFFISAKKVVFTVVC